MKASPNGKEWFKSINPKKKLTDRKQKRILDPVSYLRRSFFAKIVRGQKPLTISATAIELKIRSPPI